MLIQGDRKGVGSIGCREFSTCAGGFRLVWLLRRSSSRGTVGSKSVASDGDDQMFAFCRDRGVGKSKWRPEFRGTFDSHFFLHKVTFLVQISLFFSSPSKVHIVYETWWLHLCAPSHRCSLVAAIPFVVRQHILLI